jgi:hypothetical protein
MALAKKNVRIEERITEVEVEDGIDLHLSQEEADALATILANIGGHPSKTRRGLTDAVKDALRGAGARGNISDLAKEGESPGHCGSIYFVDPVTRSWCGQ